MSKLPTPPLLNTADFIRKHEGVRKDVYLDPTGNPTVGVGHLLTPEDSEIAKTGRVSDEQAEEMFQEDIRKHQSFLNKVTVPLTAGQRMALTSLAFNVGPNHRAIERIVALTNAGDHKAAADEFLKYDKAEDKDTGEMVQLPGLVKRRQAEHTLFLARASTPTTPKKLPPPPVLGTKKSDIGGAIGRGIETSLNPFGTKEEEYRKERTGAEMGAEAAANIATDIVSTIGASALAGAAIGSVVPGAGTAAGATVGLGLGLYRALGYEDHQSRVRGEKFNVGRAAMNVAVEINPVLKYGGKITKGVTQGALQAMQTLGYGGTAGDAALGGLLGGVAGAASARSKAPKVPSPEAKAAKVAGMTAMMSDETLGPVEMQRMVDALDAGDNSLKLARTAFDKMKANEKTESALSKVFAHTDLFESMQDAKTIRTMFDGIPDDVVNVSPEQIKSARRLARMELKASGQAVSEKAVATLTPQLAKRRVLEDEATAVARWITRKHDMPVSAELFQAAKEQLSHTSMSQGQAFELYRMQKYLKEAATEAASKAAEEGTGLKDPLGMAVFRWFSDLKFAARAVDRPTGLNLEGMTDAVSHKKNLHGIFMYGITHKTNTLLKQAKSAGLSRSQVVDLLEKGADRTSSGPTGEILKGFRSVFDEIADYGNKNGLKIDKIENYVTRLSQDPANLVTSLRRRTLQYRNGKAILRPEALQDKQLHQVFEHVTGVAIPEGADEAATAIRRALHKLDNISALKTTEGFDAVGSFQRKGEIPDFVREKDIGKILIRYANNTSKSIHMDPIIRTLQTQIPILDALGFEKSSKYFQNYVKNLSGQQSEVVGWMTASQNRWKTGLDELIDSQGLKGFKKAQFEAAKSIPDFLSWSLSLIYPNYLGLSTKAILRNYTQPHMMTAPELRGKYGYKLVTKAWLSTLRDMKSGVKLEETLQAMGYVPGQHIGEGMNEAASAMRATMLGPMIAGVDKVNEKLMYLYSKSDIINRYVTLNVARQVTKDALSAIKNGVSTKDQAAAMKFIENLSPGVKSSIYKLTQEGRMDHVEDLLSRYLISKTQFNYGPQAASEYARTMGRMFSMFTKWPTMVAGDVHELFVTQQFRTMAERYLAPWAVLGGLQLWLSDTKDSPRKRALLGKSLLDISPMSSLTVSPPPVVDIVGGVGRSFMDAASMDFEKAGTGLARSLLPVMPLGHGVNRISQDMYHLIRDKKAPWRARESR